MKTVHSVALLSAAALLSACGGSSSGGSPFTETGPITIPNLNAAGEEFFDVLVAADAGTITPQSLSELEAIGTADFAGFMIAEPEGSNEALVGRTRISANFADGGSLTGSVTDLAIFPEGDSEEIVDASDEDDLEFEPIPDDAELVAIAGSLTLSNGSTGTEGGFGIFDIDVAGDVTIPGSLIDGAAPGPVAFDVSGQLIGAVSDSGLLIAGGALDAAGEGFSFDLDATIFAE